MTKCDVCGKFLYSYKESPKHVLCQGCADAVEAYIVEGSRPKVSAFGRYYKVDALGMDSMYIDLIVADALYEYMRRERED